MTDVAIFVPEDSKHIGKRHRYHTIDHRLTDLNMVTDCGRGVDIYIALSAAINLGLRLCLRCEKRSSR